MPRELEDAATPVVVECRAISVEQAADEVPAKGRRAADERFDDGVVAGLALGDPGLSQVVHESRVG